MLTYAPLYPLLHPLLKNLFFSCLWTGDHTIPEIALTFDDGPHPQYTPELIKVLEEYQIKATFFWLGVAVEQYPEIAQLVREKGHGIGIHGYQHISFPFLTESQLKQDLEKTQKIITEICQLPLETVRDVRPPNGIITPPIVDLLNTWNYRTVMWSVVPEDWVRPGVEIVTNRVLQQTKNGSIIVLHEGEAGGQDVAACVRQILPPLLQKNYQFVLIDRLWRHSSSVQFTVNR